MQLSALLLEHDEIFKRFTEGVKSDIIKAGLRELGDACNCCNVPFHEQLNAATFDKPVNWDAISNFTRGENQSMNSYNEQLLAVRIGVDAIDNYLCIMNIQYTKNVIITGFPGRGKTFVMMYVVLYARSKGLTVITVALMAHRAIQLGGWHWHKLLCIPVDRNNNMSVCRTTELAWQKLDRHPQRKEFVKSIHVFFNDEIGQKNAELDNVIDNLSRLVSNNNVYMGGKLLIGTYDPTQLQPISGRPLLTSPNVIPCYKIVLISTSVCT